jgi:hypothetical protein
MVQILRAFLLLVLLGLLGTAAVADSRLTATEQEIVQFIDGHNDKAMVLLERVVNINSGTMNFTGVREVGAVLRAEEGMSEMLRGATKRDDGQVAPATGERQPQVVQHTGCHDGNPQPLTSGQIVLSRGQVSVFVVRFVGNLGTNRDAQRVSGYGASRMWYADLAVHQASENFL